MYMFVVRCMYMDMDIVHVCVGTVYTCTLYMHSAACVWVCYA